VLAPEAVSQYQRPVTCFYAKVAGVSKDNRQAAIAKLSALETLDLVPEADNPHDPYAIKVCRRTGEQIGYLKRERARWLVEKLKLGHRCSAFVKRVSGGETHYVSITVLVVSPGATDQQVLDWINRYDVLGGITLSLSPEGKLVASPAVDLVCRT
jgi:HIRAN domain